jgi:hypothetical protein
MGGTPRFSSEKGLINIGFFTIEAPYLVKRTYLLTGFTIDNKVSYSKHGFFRNYSYAE